MRFQGMAESIGPMWSDKNQIPGRDRATSRWSAPCPGKRTRREDHALLIVRDEFRTGYSSIGLLASRARLRFTGYRQNKTMDGAEETNYHRTVSASFPPCLTEGVHPIHRRSSAAICSFLMF